MFVNLHGLGSPDHEVDPGEADYWVAPELLEETIALAARYRQQVTTHFTFDDGNLSDLTQGAARLANADHSATFFVLSSRIGAPHYLSATDIAELRRMGRKIGTHGADHCDWTALDKDGLERELVSARREIAAVAGHEITDAAIPFGRYNGAVVRALRAHGYRAAYSSDGAAAVGWHWRDPAHIADVPYDRPTCGGHPSWPGKRPDETDAAGQDGRQETALTWAGPGPIS